MQRAHILLLGSLLAQLAWTQSSAPPYRAALLVSSEHEPWTERLADRLRAQGVAVTNLTAAQIADKHAFSADAVECLIVPDSPRFPAAAGQAVLAFVKQGGDLALLGGRAFAESGAGVDGALRREAFDDYDVYRLRDVCAVTTVRPEADESSDGASEAQSAPGATAAATVLARGAFTGWSALGFPELGAARYVPLLAAQDRRGRTRGWAAGALVHHAGAFAGSQWLLAGIHEPAFYAEPDVQRCLADALAAFRSGRLLERSRAACEAPARSVPKPQPAAAPSPLRIENGHFVRPDGSRFFAIGANFFNSFHTYYGGGKMWNEAELARDFQRMRRAGVNAIRLHDAQRFLQDGRADVFLGLCRRHGVYILPTAAAVHSASSLEELAAEARRKAALLKDEPAMLGYDLDNEPYWWELGRLTKSGRRLSELHPVPKDAWKPYQRSLNLAPTDWTTTFPGLSAPLPPPEEPAWRQAYQSVSAIYGDWIAALSDGIRAEDARHPITVGYNTVYGCLPVNARLDFVAHHVYEQPEDLARVRVNLSTLDRLRAIRPGQPVLLGEFGYSNGDLVGGAPLDVYASSVGEFAHYLYALSGGFDGVFKWELCDSDPAYQWRWLTWLRDAPEGKRLQQRRFGMFVYDGTPEGRAKPIAHATRALREWLGSHAPQGRLTLRPAGYATGAAYTFEADGAFFVGDTRFVSENLRFDADEPANVMLVWDARALQLLTTADARVSLRPAHFVKGLSPSAHASGVHGGADAGEQGWLTLTALEGEVVTLRAE